jgi:hypothetical protein
MYAEYFEQRLKAFLPFCEYILNFGGTFERSVLLHA